jgi:hypothetical protein
VQPPALERLDASAVALLHTVLPRLLIKYSKHRPMTDCCFQVTTRVKTRLCQTYCFQLAAQLIKHPTLSTHCAGIYANLHRNCLHAVGWLFCD